MARSSRKADLIRARVKKYRKKRKLKSAYENAVRAELKRREKMEKNRGRPEYLFRRHKKFQKYVYVQ